MLRQPFCWTARHATASQRFCWMTTAAAARSRTGSAVDAAATSGAITMPRFQNPHYSPHQHGLRRHFSTAKRLKQPRRRQRQFTPAAARGKTLRASEFVAAESTSSSWTAWYAVQLEERPLLTKSLTSGAIAAAGDLLCQAIVFVMGGGAVVVMANQEEDQNTTTATTTADSTTIDTEKDKEVDGTNIIKTQLSSSFVSFWRDAWDAPRTFRFATLGTLLVGPVIHVWYNSLARLLPGTSAVRVVQRVALDQFVFTPAFLTMWLSALWQLEGKYVVDDKTNTDDNHQPDDYLRDLQQSWIILLPANWCLWIPAQMINFKFVPLPYQVLFSNVVALLWNAFLSFTSSSQKKNE